MKVGEIWNDKTDGSKVKIWMLEYDKTSGKDMVFVEYTPEGNTGFGLERMVFLEHFEKCED
jgi:hypothetical protein